MVLYVLIALVSVILAIAGTGDGSLVLVLLALPAVVSLSWARNFTVEARLSEERFELERRAEEALAQEDLAPRAWAGRLAPELVPDFAGFEVGRVYQAGSGLMAGDFFDIFKAQNMKLVLLLTYLIVLVTMVYGPMAAALVEMFPTRIRYSGMSLPYHIGNGWFGGLLPATAFAISAQSGNIYAGLWYAIVVAVMTVVIGLIFVSNSGHRRSLFGDDPGHELHHSGYQDAPPSKGW